MLDRLAGLFGGRGGSKGGAESEAATAQSMVAALNDARPFTLASEKYALYPDLSGFPQWAINLFQIQPQENVVSIEQMRVAAHSMGSEEGAAAGRGEHHARRVEELPGREILESMAKARVAEVRKNAGTIRGEIAQWNAGMTERVADASELRNETDKKINRLREEREKEGLPAVTPSRVSSFISDNGAYAFILLVLVVAEFPTIFTALGNTSIPKTAAYVLGGALSLVAAATAHILGEFAAGALTDIQALRSKGASAPHSQTSRTLKMSDSLARPGSPEAPPASRADAWAQLSLKSFVFLALLGIFVFATYELYVIRREEFELAAKEAARSDAAREAATGVAASAATLQDTTGNNLALLLFFFQLVFFLIAFSYAFIRIRDRKQRDKKAEAIRKARSIDKQEKELLKLRDYRDMREGHFMAKNETLDALLGTLEQIERDELLREEALLEEVLALHDHAYETAEHSGPMRGGGSQ